MNKFLRDFKPPIIQYYEVVPRDWWEKIRKQNPRKRLRIKRAEPQTINCRCSFNTIIK